RDLAFRLKKQRRGYYVRLEYDSQPPALKELERNLRLSEDVLRFLSVVRSAPTPPAQVPAPPPAAAPVPPETDSEAQ
ncbi:MAG: 30S ribosomal protein S6, partial [Deltaproteobacteria bacterium]|nr:30S ribosomal protein S6 [Deltaproteobacteria bacterium]